MMGNPQGWRTFIVDLGMVAGLTIVTVALIWANWKLETPTDPDIIWAIVGGFGALAGRGYLGKKAEGAVEIKKLEVAQISQVAQIEATTERVKAEKDIIIAKAEGDKS